MWMKSLQHSFKHLKTRIAGKCSETHNYSSTPKCCRNNFIVNTLVFFTSFTREVRRAGGNSQAAGSVSVIHTICLMTFSKSISLLPRDPLLPLQFSCFLDSEETTILGKPESKWNRPSEFLDSSILANSFTII